MYESSNSKTYSFSANQAVVEAVPATARRILDVGCGTGANAEWLKHHNPDRIIDGITLSESEAELASKFMDAVMLVDVEHWSPAANERYDCVVLSHILEHLVDPTRVLARALGWLNPGGTVVVAVPNILHIEQRLSFLLGKFRYTSYGIMDSTHLRFFDHFSINNLVTSAGYTVAESRAIPFVPLGRLRWRAPAFARFCDRLAERLCPDLFGWQFVICARPDPANLDAKYSEPALAFQVSL